MIKKIIIWFLSAVVLVVAAVAFVWFANPLGVRDNMLVNMIVKMRVSPERLENILSLIHI